MMSDVTPPRFLPLVGLANVLTVLLAVVLAAIALRLAVVGLGAGSEHWRHDFMDLWLDKAVNSLGLALGIVFVMWFRRARINAGRSGWPQRRSIGWTFWGWIVPIVSLWLPFQIMGDIWRAGLPESKRNKVAWLPTVWWTTWLLASVITAGDSGWMADFGLDLTRRTGVWSLWVLLVSGSALIIIIRRVSCGPVGRAR
jgi:hypothetical protein